MRGCRNNVGARRDDLWLDAPIIGWARPTPTNPRKYRNYKRGDILVSMAGVVGNLGLAVMFALLHLGIVLLARAIEPMPWMETAAQLFGIGVWLNVMLIFFNLLPVPPLDGSHLFYYLLPPGLGARYRSIQRFGILPLLALMLLAPGLFHWLLGPAYYGMRLLQHIIAPFAIGDGWNIFSA